MLNQILSIAIKTARPETTQYGVLVSIVYYLNIVIAVVLGIVYIMQYVHTIISIFYRGKSWKKAKTHHTFGYLICGRNEKIVIGNLIDSIFMQNYDKDKMFVYVCADNCTDETAQIAREHGAIVFERNNEQEIGKSYALEFLINNVKQDEHYKDIEAFFIFDADNLLTRNYTLEMNNLLDAGVKVSTSFRESKNYDSSWVSACASIMFYRECYIVHNSKMFLNEGTYVSGTGFYLSKDVLEMFDGWPFRTMTEDIEFSIWCNLNNIQVAYCKDAIFYDEQPITMKLSSKQRVRWCKGMHQCAAKYDSRILKKYLRCKDKLGIFELFGHISPFPIIGFAWTIIYVILMGIFCATGLIDVSSFLHNIKDTGLGLLSGTYIVAVFQALFVTFVHHKHSNCSLIREIWYSFLFPIFAFTFIPLSIKALFSKVKWTHIPHTVDRKI